MTFIINFHLGQTLMDWAGQAYLIKPNENTKMFSLIIYKGHKWVFHGNGNFFMHCFYMYDCLFQDLLIRFPFN